MGASCEASGGSWAHLGGFLALFSQLGAIRAQSFFAKPLLKVSVRPLSENLNSQDGLDTFLELKMFKINIHSDLRKHRENAANLHLNSTLRASPF